MSGAFSPPPKLDDLSATSLSAIADDDLEYALSSYVAEHIEVRGGDFEAIETLPPRLLTWYVSYIVDAEVLNGGFNQLFFNPSGQYASMAPEAFDAIGAPEAKAIVTEALALLEQHAPALEAAADAGTLEAFMETYLDQPFATSTHPTPRKRNSGAPPGFASFAIMPVLLAICDRASA